MACYPKIDQPCPLGVDAQKRINGYCGQCRKTVHSLDGLDAAARSALLVNAGAPICVSYRVPARMGAALMLSIAGAAFAGEVADVSVASPTISITTVATPVDAPEEPEIMMMGGIREPGNAEWVETDNDSALPELPVIVDDAQ